MSSAKVLGVNISSDLKWSAHIGSITVKAAKRLYLLRQLKRAGIDCNVLVRFFYICYSPAGRSVLGKTVPDVLDTARGRRPRAVSKTEGIVFPNTDQPSAGE